MDLKEIYKKNKTVLSFEVFPPKDDLDGFKKDKLIEVLKDLKKFKPSLISLTYGAGGTNREASLDLVKRIKKETALEIMPHFTCVCSSKNQIEQYLEDIKELKIENILALRGDEPQNIDVCHLDFKYANELVSFIKANTELSIGVAGYPEGHIACPSLELDIRNLKRKVNAGADVIYTQLFFDNEKFYKFIDLIRKEGIEIPVAAGILPVTSYNQLNKMINLCRVSLPEKFKTDLEKFKENPADIEKLGIEFAINQCKNLVENGIEGLHFYTLNKSKAVSAILDEIGL
jgi:methylenetetrahydrofolate reductase (NADPH)